MNAFDLCLSALAGVNLIEAGAGTGKTYTIAGLFLRLIAEVGLTIDQILVVTYTNAATDELRSRIRNRLSDAKNSLDNNSGADAVLSAILQKKPLDAFPALLRRRINDALTNFDQAAIFTIHGFCRRVLQRHAFETGHLFDAELTDSDQDLILSMAEDWWRRHIVKAPPELAACAIKELKGPQAVAELLQFIRFPEIELRPPALKPSLRCVGVWRRSARQVQEQWPAQREQVMKLLLSSSLNATWYGKCEDNDCPAGTSARTRTVAELAAVMDQWNGQYPLPAGFEKFSSRFLIKATKKKQIPVTHPFFEICQQALEFCREMEVGLTAYLRYLKVRLLGRAAVQLKSQKDKLNLLSFDDLLSLVHQAVCGRRQQALIENIQSQYRAALVDEFQDTDPQQYTIFKKLFTGPLQVLFMIGDPKQAIYSFRGADLFSYLQAKSDAHTRYGLSCNWRADPALTQAVNTIFSSHVRPFGLGEIDFTPACPAHSSENSKGPPLKLWYLTSSGSEKGAASATQSKPFNQKDAVHRIVNAVVCEIISLLNHPQQTVAPEHIAVLTRTHRQAQLIKLALARSQVPAVLHSAGSVFDTPEARDLTLILQAVANPTAPAFLRTALATEVLGVNAHTLCRWLEDGGAEWSSRSQSFHAYFQIWQRYGFYRMFSHLLVDEGIKARLLGLPDGERRLTNLLHLAELLHQASTMHQLGPEGLMRWLKKRRQDLAGGDETEKLRLESDARAVRIITLHKSKGLEFEIVFCPFAWSGIRSNSQTALYHDRSQQDRLTLAIGPDIDAAAFQQSQIEELCESIRLLYVALTRAKRRCYLMWGRINQTELSAPAFIFHGRSLSLENDGLQLLHDRMASLSEAEMIADLHTLADDAGGTIEVAAVPESEPGNYRTVVDAVPLTPPRVFHGRFNNLWRIASYSAMTANAVDLQNEGLDQDRDWVRLDDPMPGERISLSRFPKGPQIGLFFHRLMEQWPLSDADRKRRRVLISECLQAFGLDQAWIDPIDTMLAQLAVHALPGLDGDFTLGQIAPENVVKEMEFYFPIHSTSVGQLSEAFSKWIDPAQHALLEPFLNRLAFPTLQGFMKGYIDMIFCHHERYYLVDWKSNYLGQTHADYAPERLTQVMTAEYYFLQYHIYTLALDQWLRRQLPRYSYESHFGGVFYIFLRGIHDRDKASGIYFTLPEHNLVRALRAQLIAEDRLKPASQ